MTSMTVVIDHLKTPRHPEKPARVATYDIFQKVFQGTVTVEEAKQILRGSNGMNGTNGNRRKPNWSEHQ